MALVKDKTKSDVAKKQKENEIVHRDDQVGSFRNLPMSEKEKVLRNAITKEGAKLRAFLMDEKKQETTMAQTDGKTLKIAKIHDLPEILPEFAWISITHATDNEKQIAVAIKDTGIILPFSVFNMGREITPRFFLGISDEERTRRMLTTQEHFRIVEKDTASFSDAALDMKTAMAKHLPAKDPRAYWDSGIVSDVAQAEAHLLYGWRQALTGSHAMCVFTQAIHALISIDMAQLYEISAMNECALGTARSLPHAPMDLDHIPKFEFKTKPPNTPIILAQIIARTYAMIYGHKFCPHVIMPVPRYEMVMNSLRSIRVIEIIAAVQRNAPTLEMRIEQKITGRDYTFYLISCISQQNERVVFLCISFNRIESALECIFDQCGTVATQSVLKHCLENLIETLTRTVQFTGGFEGVLSPLYLNSIVDLHTFASQHIEDAEKTPKDIIPDDCPDLDTKRRLIRDSWINMAEAKSLQKILIPDGLIYVNESLAKDPKQELHVSICETECDESINENEE